MKGRQPPSVGTMLNETFATAAVIFGAMMAGNILGIARGPQLAAVIAISVLMGLWAHRTGHWYLFPAAGGEAQDDDKDANQGR